MKTISSTQKRVYADLWKKVNSYPLKEEAVIVEETPVEKPANSISQEEAISFSVKIIQALEHIRAVNNKDFLNKKVSINRLIEVYKVNAHHHEKLEELNKTCNQWALACVIAFLASRHGEDLSPIEKDFSKADDLIKELQLNFSFNDIEDLYLSPPSSEDIIKPWF